MIITFNAPEINEMPRMDRDVFEEQRNTGHLRRMYQDWIKTCNAFSVEMDDVPIQLIEGLKRKILQLLLNDIGDRCFEVVEFTGNADGIFGKVRIGGLTREKSREVAKVLQKEGLL